MLCRQYPEENQNIQKNLLLCNSQKQVIEHSLISGKYNIDGACMGRWWRNFENIRLRKPSQEIFTGRSTKEIEDYLFNWISEQRNNGMPILNKNISNNAHSELI